MKKRVEGASSQANRRAGRVLGRGGGSVARSALLVAALWALAAALTPDASQAQTQVRFSGEHYVYAESFANRNFTGWSLDGAQTEDAFSLWQRLRLRADITRSDSLGFCLWLQVNNTPWGDGTFTVDNPQVAVQVMKAYLQFTLPGTPLEITVGKQTLTLPQSEAFWGSIVFDTETGALAARLPLSAWAEMTLGYARPLSYLNALESLSGSRHTALDMLWLTLPMKGETVSASPWAVLATYSDTGALPLYSGSADGPPGLGYITQELYSLGYFRGRPGFRLPVAPYVWGGAALKVQAGDWAAYADLVAGSGAAGDAAKNARRGLFVDAALEYNGLGWGTPRVWGWWSSGEDGSDANGSERLPSLVRTWNMAGSYLFTTGQTFDNTTNVNASPIGHWGLGAVLDQVSFIEGVTSRLGFTAMFGNNRPGPLKRSVLLDGPGTMVAMGKNLCLGEYLLGVNLDTTWEAAPGLKLVLETGWAHPGGLRKDVWGARFVNAAKDSWKVAAGFFYAF